MPRAILMSSKKLRAVGSMHVFAPCQIDFVNKKLNSPHSWNNPLSETSLGLPSKSLIYVLMIWRYPDAKGNHFVDVKKTYFKYNKLVLKGTLIPILKMCYTFLRIKIMRWKFYSLIPSKINSPFTRYSSIRYQFCKRYENFLKCH